MFERDADGCALDLWIEGVEAGKDLILKRRLMHESGEGGRCIDDLRIVGGARRLLEDGSQRREDFGLLFPRGVDGQGSEEREDDGLASGFPL